jgi:hypothetical protein
MADSSTPFINKNDAITAYTESKSWLRPYFEPIDELERIARNKPSSKIDPNLPKITDGTTAAIVQETPKRVIQQTPSGLTTSKASPEYGKLADIILRDELIPSYNRMGNMLQKSWAMVGKSMTWGRATSYTFYTSTNGKLHTDFVYPYVKDILTEKGKVYAGDSNIRFMRSWYQKRDLMAILQQEQKMEKTDKKYKSDWDLKLLSDLIDSSPAAKGAEYQTPAEREKGGDNGGYEVIHAFQNGVNAEFYSFSPGFKDGRPLRVKVNKDPRGVMPFDDLYCNIDGSNPLGRGSVELSGGVQNLIDQQMQMFQFMSTLEMAPPLKVYGNVNKAGLKLRPNAIWDMGNGANNNVEAYAFSNFALQNFTGNMQSLQSKIMQLNSSQDTSIGAENGNSGQSKTQAGVEATQAKLGVSDNYFRKQYEDWFEDQSETSLNLYFSEMTGKQTLDLDKNDLKEVAKSPAAKFLTPEGKLNVPYKEISDVVFTFQVNAGTSEIKEDAENVDKLIQTLELAKQTPNEEIQSKVGGLFKLLVKEIGAEGVDELFPEDETGPDGQPIQAQPQQPQMAPEQIQQLVMETVQAALQEEKAKKPEIDPQMELIKALGIKFDQIPEGARQQILDSLGFNTGEMTPVEQKQALEQLTALNQADDHERAPELAQQDRDFQAQQADKQSAQQAQTSQSQETAPAQPEQPQGDTYQSPEEEQLVEALLQRGFSEDDVEQAVMMTRQGMPLEEVIGVLGSKQY